MRIGVNDFSIEEITSAAQNDRLLSFDLWLKDQPENRLSEELWATVCQQARALGAVECKIICSDVFSIKTLSSVLAILNSLQITAQAVVSASMLTEENIHQLFKHQAEVHFFAENDQWKTALELLRTAGYASQDAPAVKVLFLPERGKVCELLSNISQVAETFAEPVVSCMTLQGKLPDIEKNLTAEETQLVEEKLNTVLPGCLKLACSCCIDNSGNVYPCAAMQILLGNVRNNTLEEIILQSKVSTLHREHPKRVKTPCAECPEVWRCAGCAAGAYAWSGDYMAADPYCVRNKDKQPQIPVLPIPSKGMLPHADSMLLIDRIVYMTELYSVHEALIREDNPLLEPNGTLAGNALAEYAAQAAALRDSVEKGGKPSPGLLCEVSKVKFFKSVKVNDTLQITVRTEYNIDSWYGIAFEISSSGEKVAEGALKLCIYDDSPLPY